MAKRMIGATWFVAAVMTAASVNGQASPDPTVVLLDYASGKASYSVNSRSLALRELLNALGHAFEKGAREAVVLVHEDNSLRKVAELRELLGKVGYVKVSYYYFDRSKRSMQTFRFGDNPVPFAVPPAAKHTQPN